MKSMMLLKSVLLVALLSGCATLGEKLAISYDLPVAEEYWLERFPPTVPLNRAETLSANAAAGLMNMRQDDASVFYEGIDDSYIVMRHEELITSEDSQLVTVKYRIRGGLVYGATIPFVVEKHDPEKENFATQIALNSVNGNNPDIPILYNGRVFVAKPNYTNSCIINVVEKDINREYATYRIRTC